jgi:S1-C subfamily serine protease
MNLLALKGAVAGAVLVAAVTHPAAAADPSPLPATIDRIRHAIVAVGTNEPTRNPSFQFRGTGFAVGDGSLIATNNHVLPAVLDPAARETLTVAIPLPNGEATLREATTVARDPDHDMALLRISGPPLPAMKIGDSTQVREGQSYAFTGFPIGNVIGVFPTTHRALISAITPVALSQPTARTLDPALIKKLRSDRFAIFQLDATAYPGNSGSPMYDPETGDVIAIVNSGFVKAGKESALSNPSGISYAIPTVYLAQLLESVRRDAP